MLQTHGSKFVQFQEVKIQEMASEVYICPQLFAWVPEHLRRDPAESLTFSESEGFLQITDTVLKKLSSLSYRSKHWLRSLDKFGMPHQLD